MPTEIPWEKRIAAEDLYITGNCTYAEVSRRTGVSVSQLKRWGAEGNWKEEKKEMLESLSAIKQNTVKLRLGLIEKAIAGYDPQQTFAAAQFEKIALKAAENRAKNELPERVESFEFETPGEAVDALQNAVERKIGMLISGDDLDLKSIKDMKQALELLDGMKVKYNPEDKKAKNKGLSDEAADEIRKKILGIG